MEDTYLPWTLLTPTAYKDWLLRGAEGFSQSWLDGKWTSPEVDRCVELAFRSIEGAVHGFALPTMQS